jgi:hypothetical protein
VKCVFGQVKTTPNLFNINHFALQELNISQNHFHLPDRTSWVSFSLAPGNRTTVNVEPCTTKVKIFMKAALHQHRIYFRQPMKS